MLELKNVSTSYGPVGMLRNLDLSVGKGELVCLLGPNGAGKSTTFKALAGLLPLDGGQVLMMGQDVAKLGAEKLAALSSCTTCYGLDISKVAIRYAAKRYTSDAMQFCVASSQRLPFADGSLNTIVRIYAPCHAQELARVLADQGVVITVTPAARHLYQLKERVYQQVHLHDETPEQIAGFSLIEETKLGYDMTLTGQQADDLLQMTPFAWKANAMVRSQLAGAAQFMCSADFMIRVYRKCEPD